MSKNEIIEYENFLNRHSSVKKWKYIDWPVLQSMFNPNEKDPVCLIAFKSEKGAGIDPYNGLPYEKYLYFMQADKPRYKLDEFMDQTGQSLLNVLDEKYGIYASKIIPEFTYKKSLFKMEAVPQPPVVEGSFEISFSCTIKSANGGNLEIEGSKDGFKAKAHGAFKNIIGSFKLDFNSRGGDVINIGVKSSVLTGDFGDGEFTTQLITTLPLPGGLIKIKGSGSYKGTERRYINGVEWDLEYSLEYEAEVTLKRDELRRNPGDVKYVVPVRVPEKNPVADPLDMNRRQVEQNSWWDRHGDSVTAGLEIAGGVALVGLAVVLTVGTDGLAAPVTALMARRGTMVVANGFYATQALAH